MYEQTTISSPSMREKEMLIEILMDSDLYLELPLKERHSLFKHIVNVYYCPVPVEDYC